MKVVKFFFFLFSFTSLLISCNQRTQENGQEYRNPFVNYTQTLTQTDTSAVKNVVTKFMNYAKEGSYEQAVALLYKPDSEDIWNEPVLLNDEELHEIAYFLKSLPFDSFSIDYIKFFSPVNTDVKCTIKRKDGQKEIKRSIHFSPMNFLGGWRLCLMK